MAGPCKFPERVDGSRIGFEMPKHRRPAMVLRPRPKLSHMTEVCERGNPIPRPHGVERDVRAKIGVVAVDPAAVEVGHNTVEIDTKA